MQGEELCALTELKKNTEQVAVSWNREQVMQREHAGMHSMG